MRAAHRRPTAWVALCGVAACGPLAAQTPEQALDAAWVAVCANAPAGSEFAQRCAEILAAGPGSGARRSAAAIGNRLGQLPAQPGGASERRSHAEERVALAEEEPWGLQLVLGFGEHERSAGAREAGFRGDLARIGLGIERRLGERWVLGALVSRTRAERRFLADAGRADSRERSLSLFLDGTPAEGWGVNLYAGHGDRDLDLERRIAYTLVLNAGQPNQSTLGVNALAVARPDGGHTRAGAALERNLAFGATSLSLRLASDWSRVVIEPFVESGGAGLALARGRNRLISHTVNLGLELAHAGSFGGGVFQPYLRATLLRELRASPPLAAAAFAADPRRTPIVFERDALDRSYAEAALGAVTVFGGGWSAFAELEGLLGNRDFDQFLFSAGARRSF